MSLISMAAICMLTEALYFSGIENLVISASFEAAVIDERWNFSTVRLQTSMGIYIPQNPLIRSV